MRRIVLYLILSQISLIHYGQIIADHTIVGDYDKIPQYYLDLVKKMWVTIPGESHSYAYQDGLIMVEDLDSRFQVNATTSGSPEAYTTEHLRVSNGTWGDYSNSSGWIYNYGEEDWWTNATAIVRTKAGITYCNTNSLTISAMGFGWCYDPYADGSTAGTDPVYGCHWWGWSVGSPSGDSAWGIDAGDYAVTGNDVSMDTYLSATQAYIDYCVANGYTTKVFFTTGPVDKGVTPRPDEEFYQAYLKYEHIRDYVKADKTRILFDYADILCYSNAGVLSTKTWNGITFPAMVPAYDINESSHVSLEANLRIGKALWWMLARIAGWDGIVNTVPVSGITVTGAGGATTITTDNGTLQLSAAVSPADASNKTVSWSISNGTGQASVSTGGMVTAIANGIVTARATANDGSGVYGTLVITISNQVNVIPVSGITVTGAGGATTITTDNGTLQLSAAVSPSDATNKTVSWSISNGTGQASVSNGGMVTAIANGTVTARATANDGSGVYGTLVITISNQVNVIPVSGITVTGAGGATTITTDNGTLQLSAAVSPSDATNKTVSWSISNGTGQASVSTGGMVTAIANGTVTARATANDGSGILGTFVITISNQIIPAEIIIITSEDGSNIISDGKVSIQLSAEILPDLASVKTVLWSVENITGQASISSAGLVTGIDNGIVMITAAATDGYGAKGRLEITINNKDEDALVTIIGKNEVIIPLTESYLDCILSLYDLQGHLVRSKRVDSNICSFDITTLPAGIYLIVLFKSVVLKVGKVIIPG